MFKKLLVANRGEIACRVIRACRELGIKTVAIYSEVDRESTHVYLADEAICIGHATNVESYLNISNILMAAQISGADVVHPGYGYFSEKAHFVEALHSLDISFVGPSAQAIEAMGDKAKAKKYAIEAGCPVVPGSKGVVANISEAMEIAEGIGYPILLKAVAGGGGKGIRRVNNPDELSSLWRTACAEAQASFGNGDLMIEKCVLSPKHIEIQILGDHYGNLLYLGERECSVQNPRHQKMIEEAPWTMMSEGFRKRMGEAALNVARSVNYFNAGTVEFIVDNENNFYFLEMNTRLQVEHPVTEQTTGLDLVQLQLEIAQGKKLSLSQSDINVRGHSIEVRITAQDPDHHFAPSTGKITSWRAPGGNGVRLDTYVYAGIDITPFYDPMIAKLIVTAPTRQQAIAKLQTALHEFYIEGIITNISFIKKLIQDPRYLKGTFDTSFIPIYLAEQEENYGTL